MIDRRVEKLVRGACAGGALLVLASCATLNREGAVAPLDGGSVAVRQGAPLVINLSPDPATGFGWVLTSNPGDKVWLIGGPDYTPEPIPPGMLGVAGTTTFRFRAHGAGQPDARIRLPARVGKGRRSHQDGSLRRDRQVGRLGELVLAGRAARKRGWRENPSYCIISTFGDSTFGHSPKAARVALRPAPLILGKAMAERSRTRRNTLERRCLPKTFKRMFVGAPKGIFKMLEKIKKN